MIHERDGMQAKRQADLQGDRIRMQEKEKKGLKIYIKK